MSECKRIGMILLTVGVVVFGVAGCPMAADSGDEGGNVLGRFMVAPGPGVQASVQSAGDETVARGTGDAAAGELIYTGRCAGCHSLGAFDTDGFAGDLTGKGDDLLTDLGTIDPAMNGMILTDQEISDLAAFVGGGEGGDSGDGDDSDDHDGDDHDGDDHDGDDHDGDDHDGDDHDGDDSDGGGTGGDAAAGQVKYTNSCASCHSLGTFDPDGFAGDLAGEGDDLIANLGVLNAAMNGIILTEQEIADLRAFIDG